MVAINNLTCYDARDQNKPEADSAAPVSGDYISRLPVGITKFCKA